MADITLTVLDNGPYLIKGSPKMVDASGAEFGGGETVALCRSGHSGSKPFCDGTHRAVGFESEVSVAQAVQ